MCNCDSGGFCDLDALPPTRGGPGKAPDGSLLEIIEGFRLVPPAPGGGETLSQGKHYCTPQGICFESGAVRLLGPLALPKSAPERNQRLLGTTNRIGNLSGGD